MSAKSLNLADIVRQDVGAASIDAMEHFADGGEMVAADRTLEQIAADIVRKDQQVGLGLISIGNDLLEAKGKVEHGKWGEWLDLNVGYSERKAQMCMQIARRYGSNPQLVADLGIRKVTALMLLPAGEDAEFLETHDVPNMSTRELEDAIRERDEARRAAEALSNQVKTLETHNTELETRALDYSNENDDLKARIKELESAPKEVYQDEAAIQKAADEARRKTVEEWQKKTAKLDEELRKTEEKLKELREKVKQGKTDAEAGKSASAELDAAKKAQEAAEAEAERLREELDAARKAAKAAAVASDAEVSEFRLYFGLAQENINKMRGLLLKVRSREDKTTGEKLAAAMAALADAVKEAAK